MNVTPTQNAPETTPAEVQPRKPGREEFLNLLVAQLQHQDPLQPMDGTEFVTQLAQFSSVEQLMGINERLGLLEVGQASAMNTQAASFIGRQVTYRVPVEAGTEDGAPQAADALKSGVVTEVSFENGYPELVINDVRVRLGDVVAVGGSRPAGE